MPRFQTRTIAVLLWLVLMSIPTINGAVHPGVSAPATVDPFEPFDDGSGAQVASWPAQCAHAVFGSQQPYPPAVSRSWLLEPADNSLHVLLTFLSFDTEKDQDIVRVRACSCHVA